MRLRFRADIEAVAEHLITVFGLMYSKAEARLSSPIYRWIDFRMRHIDSQPRAVLYSDRFPQLLPVHIARAIKTMELRFSHGEDVNPYQGKGLILHNDFSGKERGLRTDLLWADWKISHFHLTNKVARSGEYFVPRSGYQLFALVEHNVVLFIDALPHPRGSQYADIELLKTVQRCWPEYFDQFELKSIMPGENVTDTQRYESRRSGISVPVYLNGKAYVGPGMGITTASTALRVTVMGDRMLQGIRDLADMVCAPDGQFQQEVTARSITDPRFSLRLIPMGLAVCEERSDIAFPLPRAKDGNSNWISDLHDTFYPEWAAEVVRRLITE